jgi:hypothetical protein
LDGSVIGLLLVFVPRAFDKEVRQSFDGEALLVVVELLPQVRLRPWSNFPRGPGRKRTLVCATGAARHINFPHCFAIINRRMTSGEATALRLRLTTELNAATAEYLRIQRQVIDIINEVPSGLPLSDGRSRIIQVGMQARTAFEKYWQANERLRAFVEKGIVPDEPH